MTDPKNKQSVTDRIESVLREKGLSNVQFQKSLGIYSQIWNNWKNRGVPSKWLFPIADLLGVKTDWLAHEKGPRYADQVQKETDNYPSEPLEFSLVIDYAIWKILSPQTRALIEDLINKSINGQLTPEHIKILQSMADALSK